MGMDVVMIILFSFLTTRLSKLPKIPDHSMEPEVSTKPVSAMGRAIERLKAKKELKIHKGIKRFKCNKCEIEFLLKANLKRHTISVHERTKPFECNICNYKAARSDQLKRHIQFVHLGILKCNLCEYKAWLKSDLKIHIKSVHEGTKCLKCNICEYKAGQKSDLEKHKESAHEQIKPFKCSAEYVITKLHKNPI